MTYDGKCSENKVFSMELRWDTFYCILLSYVLDVSSVNFQRRNGMVTSPVEIGQVIAPKTAYFKASYYAESIYLV